MKRICYLLVWLLTGFSIAANQSSQPETYLLSSVGTNFPEEKEHLQPQSRNVISSLAAPKTKVIGKGSNSRQNQMICSAER